MKKLSFFSSLTDQIDLFKIPVVLTYQHVEKKSTFLGKVSSCLIVTFLVYIFFVSDIVQKNNPVVVNESSDVKPRPMVFLNEKSSTFVFYLGDAITNINYAMDPTIWSIEASVVRVANQTSFSIESIPLHFCNKTDLDRYPGIYDGYHLGNNTYCLDRKSFNVSGYWDENYLTSFSLKAKKCVNSTGKPAGPYGPPPSNVVCKSQKEIDSFLSTKHFLIYYEKINIDSKNYQNPTFSNLKTYYKAIEPSYLKTVYLYLRKTEILTDDGWLVSSVKTIDSYTEGSWSFDNSPMTAGDSTFFNFLIYSDEQKTTIYRSYEKIGDVIGRLGGIANILAILGFMLAKWQHSVNVKNELINEIYSFQKKSDTSEVLKQSLFTIDSTKEGNIDSGLVVNSSKNVSSFELSKDAIIERGGEPKINLKKKKKFKNIEEEIKKEMKNEEIKIGLFKYTFMKVKGKKRRTNKEKLFTKAEEYIEKDLDIVEIIKKLHDIEKLKTILLDNTQLYLFDSLPKPRITPEEIPIAEEIKNDKFLKYYKELSEKENKNEVDLKLLQLIYEKYVQGVTRLQKSIKVINLMKE